MDGDRKAPIDLGDLGDENDALSEPFLKVIRERIARENSKNVNYNLMALLSDQ